MFTSLILILGVLAFLVSLQPAEFRISRSLLMRAPASDIFPLVNDFQQWLPWSPWVKMDPTAIVQFKGPSAGKDAVMEWAGNAKVGRGVSTIVESVPSSLIRFRQEFIKPMKTTNMAQFTFEPQDGQTLVTWTMKGTNGFVGKAFALAFSADKMVGTQFEQGLEALKALVEKPQA